MKIGPIFPQLSSFKVEGEKVNPQQHKKGDVCPVSATQEDTYDLGLVVQEGRSAPSQLGPSWPGDCDTVGGCNQTATYGNSCGGTCGNC